MIDHQLKESFNDLKEHSSIEGKGLNTFLDCLEERFIDDMIDDFIIHGCGKDYDEYLDYLEGLYEDQYGNKQEA